VSVPYAFAAGSVSYIDATGAADGDVLAYNATTGRFEPVAMSGTGGTYTTPNLSAVLSEGNSANNTTISDLAAPVNANDAATKAYVDALVAQLQEAINNIGGGGTTPNMPTVTTGTASDITTNSATLSGNVTSTGGFTVTARGFVYGTSENDLSQTVRSGDGTGSYTAIINNLTPNTTYYYKAYATNAVGTAYGEVMSFSLSTAYLPIVAATTVSDITTWGATLSGNVTSDGGLTVTSRGFVYGTNANDLTQTVTSGSGTGDFNKTITGLTASTTYYYKAYATNAVGTSYGEVLSFTTLVSTGTLSGHDWVDLGLPSGTKWATCNVGADSPTAYGDYFAWGETTPKETYNWSTYRYCNGDFNTFTKYCSNADYGNDGFTDALTTLEASDDAATANWGSGWRMPTREEMNELKNNCTVTWTTQNGVNGRLFTGPNGNSIFLPAAGQCDGSELGAAGGIGLYWSSSLYTYEPHRAWYLYLYSLNYDMDHFYGIYSGRYRGQSVRPICQQ